MSSVLDEAGYSRGNLARWKAGIIPKYSTAKRISEILEVPLSELLPEQKDAFTFDIDLMLKAITSESERESHLTELFNVLEKNNVFVSDFKNEQEKNIFLDIVISLNKLNLAGQQKALERVEELTEIPKYQRTEENK